MPHDHTRPLPGEYFRQHGPELLRIEAFSDAVFAFSISLLVISLEVPRSFAALQMILKSSLSFFCTVALLFLLWYQQYIFFRHYGLKDRITLWLNLLYLAMVLFYVYPLKFLFSLLITHFTGFNQFESAHENPAVVISQSEFPQLIMLFGAGYAVVWLVLAALHRHALRQQHLMGLNAYEVAYTKAEVRGALWQVVLGIASIGCALLHWETMAGLCYTFIPLALWYNRHRLRQALKKTAAANVPV